MTARALERAINRWLDDGGRDVAPEELRPEERRIEKRMPREQPVSRPPSRPAT